MTAYIIVRRKISLSYPTSKGSSCVACHVSRSRGDEKLPQVEASAKIQDVRSLLGTDLEMS